jgi:hypothetical protein
MGFYIPKDVILQDERRLRRECYNWKLMTDHVVGGHKQVLSRWYNCAEREEQCAALRKCASLAELYEHIGSTRPGLKTRIRSSFI